MANFDIPIFTLNDVRQVRKDVSVNIDDFEQYAIEAQRNYLSKLLGDKLYKAMVDNQAEARMVNLIEGEVYTDGGKDVIFRGVKIYTVYIWLYLYSLASSASLTPIGSRIFKDVLAEEASQMRATKQNTDHFLGSADGMEESIIRYLDKKRSIYPEFVDSFQIRQASKDNFTFRSWGRTWTKPDNFIV